MRSISNVTGRVRSTYTKREKKIAAADKAEAGKAEAGKAEADKADADKAEVDKAEVEKAEADTALFKTQDKRHCVCSTEKTMSDKNIVSILSLRHSFYTFYANDHHYSC